MNTPQSRQDWILNELSINGRTSYNECFTKYLQAFTNLSRQTFSKDWKIATQRHRELSEIKERAITEAMVGEAVKKEAR